ncbi:MAG: hypothetical protein ABII64_05895 [Elusimicrobiota bacterium]
MCMRIISGILIILFIFCSVSASVAKPKPKTVTTFESSKRYYARMVAKGAGPAERIAVIDRILKKYKAKRYQIKLTQFKIERNYLDSWLFYLKRKNAGDPETERMSILERILFKYKPTGTDVSLAQNEYDALMEARRKTELLQAPTPQVLLKPPTVQVLVEVSTAPPPSPPPALPPEKPPKYFGVALYAVGFYGLTGVEAIGNLGRNFSVSIGQGDGSLDGMFLESGQTVSRSSQAFLVRYGKQIYLATGMYGVASQGTVTSGSDRKTASLSNSAIPFVLGFETGNKRGFFFGVHFAYMSYQGDSAVKLTAVDASTGGKKEFLFEPPIDGYTFCAGVGCYIF